ncbi:protein of unknown function [Taphrina deformans PYCC 5710]|uniref:Integrase catalytic domain-containing protein n=1 Tax=Taphrina deformans (strain PYCC 5710 / ATCC 11124 / CBS 356.35 / IMI 108563 / JCM 9778 / NBRC 8474) TaxID=1097556 RepID=R4XGV5_TAPDE|nr:protein of unknown function [Taphrina deformans PYCC 5710]|eukprot:CCG85118.1 protein of unknown function [Taphrina deformans PYCC 5710]
MTISLLDVMYVPEITKNLLSMGALDEKGIAFTGSGGQQQFYKDGDLVGSSTKRGKLYILDGITTVNPDAHLVREAAHTSIEDELLGCGFVEPSSLLDARPLERILLHCDKPPATLYEWHVALGHQSLAYMRKMSQRVTGMENINFDSIMPACEGCAKGKLTRPSFPESTTKQAEKLALVHSDYAGPFPTVSRAGFRYYLTFLDDYTGMCWVYPKADKSADSTCATFKQWEAMVNRQSGKRVLTLRTDGGSEYLGSFSVHCKLTGISRQITVRYTPEQNGKAERLNRTLMEKVRSILFGAKLPAHLWADLVNVACYLKNISPYKDHEKVPLEAWTGSPVDVAHLRSIGSRVWAFIPSQERNKLEPKAKEMTLIGYSHLTKAYLLWDSTTNKLELNHQIKIIQDPAQPKLPLELATVPGFPPGFYRTTARRTVDYRHIR